MKAVILAGGSGSRLRPLTCDMPKPLVPVCGKPTLEYIFDLLLRNNVDEACVTLGYLSQHIRTRYADGKYKDLRLTFSEEDTPLGTAGSVRKAAEGWNEPFFVVSGDAMCDFELEKIMLFHRASSAAATIVCFAVDDPREYGLVETDKENRVTRFLEKPSWGQATTMLANTGIYVLDPQILGQIPTDKAFDFAKELFPHCMAMKMPLFAYHAEGYWCDVGDVKAYLQTQRDMLSGKIRFPLRKAAEGIFVQDTLPAGDYKLVPPVYIGAQVDIADGAEIGPYTVLDDCVSVGARARLRGSVLLSRSSAGADGTTQDALLCADAVLQEKASMFERSVAGSGSVIGRASSIQPDVRIWPKKIVPADALICEDIQFGETTQSLFDDGGIDKNVVLSAQLCLHLGAAIGSIPACKKAGVACDGTNAGKAMLLALQAGMLSAGGHVWDFGECFVSQLSYCTAFCGLSVGVFVQGGASPQIRIFGEGGLSVPRTLEREIETRIRRREFNHCLGEQCRDVADMRSIRLMYARELYRQAPLGLRGIEASVHSPNAPIALLTEDTLLKAGCARAQFPQFRISHDGTHAEAVTQTQTVPFEKLLAICAMHTLESGLDIALPYDAPSAIDTLAAQYGRRVHRYVSAPTDDRDEAARRLAARQLFLRDGLYMTVRVLSVMKERSLSLDALCAMTPDFYVQKKTFAVSFSPAKLHALFGAGEDTSSPVREGITLRRGNGRLLITPDRSGNALHVLAEAASMETASEMCAGFERILSELEQ